MGNYSLEKEIEKVEESIRICKLNVKNQEKKLIESNKKTAIIQSKMASINSLPANEREELLNIDNRLKCQTNLQKELILECKQTLKLYEKMLQRLKCNLICNNL